MAIYDFVKHLKNYNKPRGELGIEIETETLRPYDTPLLTYWNVVEDGSLRNFGREYVLKQPVLYDKELDLALNDFHERTAHIKFIKDSHSTSVHVHINFLNETFKTLGNFLTIYSLVENILIRYCGEDRRSNLFCLPIVDAELTYKNIVNIFQNIDKKNYKGLFLDSNSVKYAALNLGAFNRYGSIELRSFRGETRITEIRNWVDLLYDILRYSRTSVTPKDIMLKWRENNTKFLNEVFGDHVKLLFFCSKEWEDLIKTNVFYAGSIAYAIKGDWNKLDELEVNTKFTPKQLEDQSMKTFGRSYENLDISEKEYIKSMLELNRYASYITKSSASSNANIAWFDEPAVAPPVARPARRLNPLGDIR